MEHIIDLDTWPRADKFLFFRGFERPHYAVTSRVDVTHLMAQKRAGFSKYRACLYAISAGLHAVPELCMRFRGDQVVRHDAVQLSMTVPRKQGSYGYAYVPWDPDFAAYDKSCADQIAMVEVEDVPNPDGAGSDAVAYASCMPWLDYTSTGNPMPTRDDCIPRISWGKFCDHGDRWDMAMTLEVHHALVDGEQVGAYFAAVQEALNTI